MKPHDLRRLRQHHEAQQQARMDGLAEFLRTGERTDRVIPELIPDSTAHAHAAHEVRRLVRVCERTPRGRRARKLDELRAAMRRLIYMEKVMALDPVERAGLTPARLTVLQAGIGTDDVVALYDRMRGESGVAVVASVAPDEEGRDR